MKSHPEWTPLTHEEKAGLANQDIWRHTAFKNVHGFEKGYVDEVMYGRLLRILNAINYFRPDKLITNHNLFNNKNYYELLLKDLPLPKIVVRYINGELLNSDFALITEEAALEIMNVYPTLVFKPAAGTGHGKCVSCITRGNYKAAMDEYAEYTYRGGGLHCAGSLAAT